MNGCQPLSSAVVVDVITSDNRYFIDAGVRELKHRWVRGRLGFKETDVESIAQSQRPGLW
jgi:hypothetical protein